MICCMEHYWQRVVRLRTERGLGKEELAQLAKLTASYVYRIEKGSVLTPSYDTAKALADALNVGVVALMEGTSESGLPPALEHATMEVAARVSEVDASQFERHLKVWAELSPARKRFLTEVGQLLLRDEESRPARKPAKPTKLRRIAEEQADYEAKEE